MVTDTDKAYIISFCLLLIFVIITTSFIVCSIVCFQLFAYFLVILSMAKAGMAVGMRLPLCYLQFSDFHNN